MSLLDRLIETPFRQPASCRIEVGAGWRNIGPLSQFVKTIEVSTERAEAATGTIVFDDRRKEDGRYAVMDSDLLQRWQPIRLTAHFGAYDEEIFRGYVKGLRPNLPNNAGEATLEVQLQDDSALLDREHIRKTWGADAPMNDLAILRELVTTKRFAVDAQSGPGRDGRSLAQDSTAIRFLRERARANGYELLFDQGSIYFGPPRLDGEPMPTILVYAGRSTNCLGFTVDDDAMKPDEVRIDVAPPDQGATPQTETVQPDQRLLGRVAAAAEGSALGAPFVWRVSREGDEGPDDMRRRAQALANEHSWKIRVHGELDGSVYGHVLKPGRLVRVDGAGERYGGLYYVDKVKHAISVDGYRQNFELIRNATGDDPAGGAGGLMSRVGSAIAGLF